MPLSERKKEIKRRRHRRKKIDHFSKKLKNATVSETGTIAEKLRKLSPGGQEIVDRWELEKREDPPGGRWHFASVRPVPLLEKSESVRELEVAQTQSPLPQGEG